MMPMVIITSDRGDRALSYPRLLSRQRQPATWLSTHYSAVELDFAPSCDSVRRRNCQMLVANSRSVVLALQSVKTSLDCLHSRWRSKADRAGLHYVICMR